MLLALYLSIRSAACNYQQYDNCTNYIRRNPPGRQCLPYRRRLPEVSFVFRASSVLLLLFYPVPVHQTAVCSVSVWSAYVSVFLFSLLASLKVPFFSLHWLWKPGHLFVPVCGFLLPAPPYNPVPGYCEICIFRYGSLPRASSDPTGSSS